MTTQLERAQRMNYEGDQTTLDYELEFLPPTVAEWHRRLELLVTELRQAQPWSGSLNTVIGETEHWCIDGVITKVAHEQGVLPGEWIDVAFAEFPSRAECPEQTEETVRQDLDDNGLGKPVPGFTTAVAALAEAGGEANRFDYSVARDLPEGIEWPEDQLDGATAPPEARLWFGMDVEPNTGKPRMFDMFDLGMQFAREVNGKYGIALPGANNSANLNDRIVREGANPLALFADAVAAGMEYPYISLWHPLLIDMAEREKALAV